MLAMPSILVYNEKLYKSLMTPTDYTAQQRAGLIIFWIMSGCRLTSADIAERCGLSQSGAWKILDDLRIVPGIVQDEDGIWRLIDNCLETEQPPG